MIIHEILPYTIGFSDETSVLVVLVDCGSISVRVCLLQMLTTRQCDQILQILCNLLIAVFGENMMQMMNDLDTLWYHADRQTDLLESISRQMSQLSTRTQLDDLLKTVRHLEQMTEQAGKPKENSFSLHRIRLPRLHLPHVSIPALISLLMAAAALLLLWWGLGTVWSSSSLLSL